MMSNMAEPGGMLMRIFSGFTSCALQKSSRYATILSVMSLHGAGIPRLPRDFNEEPRTPLSKYHTAPDTRIHTRRIICHHLAKPNSEPHARSQHRPVRVDDGAFPEPSLAWLLFSTFFQDCDGGREISSSSRTAVRRRIQSSLAQSGPVESSRVW